MINVDTIKKWWNIFVGDGNFTEVRILGKFQYSGYFKSVDSLISAIESYSDLEDEQIYFVLNKIEDSCYARQQSEKIIKSPKITTNDTDIVHRNWVMCDFDPVRKSGTNSSDTEFEESHKRAQSVFRFLRERGFEDPVICKSGNGWHLNYRINEEVSDENTEIIKGFFKYMSSQFTDDKVDFDEKNFNNARLCKLYGTMAKKGANLPERPWRMSEIVYVPSEIKVTPIEKFKELAELVPKEEPKQAPNRVRPNFGNAPFDLRTWLNEHGIVYKETVQGLNTKFELQHCPWEDEHSSKKEYESALFLAPSGQITFSCFHNHCRARTWFDFRQFYEPDAYNKPQWQPQPYQRAYAQPRPKYEIKGEIPELGKKWLTMSSIKKVDLTKLEGVKTGITELDNSIQKLYYGEVTVLSGSNSSGKSSFINTLLLNIANQGVPSALFSGELPEPILKSWIQMVAAGKRHLQPSQYTIGKYFVPTNIGDRIDQWLDDKLFIYNNEYGTQFEQLFSDMSDLAKLGVKVFVLDNLMSMNINLVEGDTKNDKQSKFILQIKKFAKENQCHIILVAHPRKSSSFLRKTDISGTADLTNAVDDVFIIHRVNNDFFRAGAEYFGQSEIQRFQGYGNVIEVCKDRMWGVVDLMVGVYYELESRRFKNSAIEDMRYGWEAEPVQQAMNFTAPQPQPQVQIQQVFTPDEPFPQSDTDEAPF